MLHLLSNTETGYWLMAIGAALISLVLMINMHKRFKLQRSQHLNPHEKLERIKQKAAIKDDLRSMMVELEELARRFSAQLDAKSIRLEQLLDEADKKITQLVSSNSPSNSPSNFPTDNTQSKITIPNSNSQSPNPNSQSSSVNSVDPLVKNIYDLTDSGKTSIEIAQKLNEQIGKIELILALRQH